VDMVLLLSKPIHSSQQSPEQSVLSHIDCFSQCEVMKLEVIKNYQVHPCVLTPCEFYCIPFKYLLFCCRTLMGFVILETVYGIHREYTIYSCCIALLQGVTCSGRITTLQLTWCCVTSVPVHSDILTWTLIC